MRTRRAGLLAVALVLCPIAGAARDAPMLPPGLWTAEMQAFHERWFGDQLRAMGERPLWTGDRRARVDRLLVLPSFAPAVAVRITRAGDGATAVTTLLDGAGGYAPGKVAATRTRRIRPAELARFDALLSGARMGKRDGSDTLVCLDGTQYVVERRDAAGHHLVSRHRCALDDGLRRAIDGWLAIGDVLPVERGGHRLIGPAQPRPA